MTWAVNEQILDPPARRAGWSHDWQNRWSHEAGRKPPTAVPCSWQATVVNELTAPGEGTAGPSTRSAWNLSASRPRRRWSEINIKFQQGHGSRLLRKLDLNNRVQIGMLVHDARLPRRDPPSDDAPGTLVTTRFGLPSGSDARRPLREPARGLRS